MRHSEARREWREGWTLPIGGMFGLSGSTIVVFSNGVFAPAYAADFGWTRTQSASGLAVLTFASLIGLPAVGWIVDRFGPRRVGLAGIVLFSIVVSLHGALTGSLWQYWALSLAYAGTGAMVSHPVWMSAVAHHFTAGRGLAFAVTLSSIGVAAAAWPALATLYSAALGWRLAFPAMALTWALVALPIAFAVLPDHISPPAGAAPVPLLAGTGYRDAILSRPFLCLTTAGALFGLILLPTIIFFIPMLRERGITPGGAAAAATIIGLSAIVSRIMVGYLLDRMPARAIGVAIFALPVAPAVLLIGGGDSLPVAIAAGALLGCAMGAETDIVTYLAARYFGLRNFAGLYGIIIGLFGVASGIGPLIGGRLYDLSGSYRSFLILIIPVVLVAAVLIALLPRPPERADPGIDGHQPEPRPA